MKKLLLTLAVICTMAMPAMAADATTKATSAQGNKMKACAAEYHEKKIPKSEYKSFMSSCLKKDSKAGETAAAPTAAPESAAATTPAAGTEKATATDQKSKMKACNADAKSKALKGAERKTFMKDCLSKQTS
jgi:hypothetical protein